MAPRTTLAALSAMTRTATTAAETFGRPGVYPARCTPHCGLGMALAVMGDANMTELAAQAASADAAGRS